MQKRLQSNRGHRRTPTDVDTKDRRTIKQVLAAETDLDKKANLREALDLLDRTRFGGATMDFIDYEHALSLVKAHTKKGRNTGKGRRPKKIQSVAFAAAALVNSNHADDLDELLKNLQQTLESANTTSARTENVRSHSHRLPRPSLLSVWTL